jgi:hypothetical protein
MFKILQLALAVSLVAAHGQAQIMVRNVTEVDVATLAYPNSTGNTTSTQPQKGSVKRKDGTEVKGKITFFKKKGVFDRVKVNTTDDKIEIAATDIAEIVLDPIVYESKYPNNFKNPEKNFQAGYIVLANGIRLNGKVAQIRDFSDYDFFIYKVLFLPEGSTIASTFKGGKLSEFGQEINGKMTIWDGYADGYLLRLVDGRYRLSRNPYSKTKNEFFTSVKNMATDSVSKKASQAALMSSLRSGNNVNESLENAVNTGSGINEVLGQVEINRKEYLIFDATSNTTATVNKEMFKAFVSALAEPCASGVKASARWDEIDTFIRQLNEACR